MRLAYSMIELQEWSCSSCSILLLSSFHSFCLFVLFGHARFDYGRANAYPSTAVEGPENNRLQMIEELSGHLLLCRRLLDTVSPVQYLIVEFNQQGLGRGGCTFRAKRCIQQSNQTDGRVQLQMDSSRDACVCWEPSWLPRAMATLHLGEVVQEGGPVGAEAGEGSHVKNS